MKTLHRRRRRGSYTPANGAEYPRVAVRPGAAGRSPISSRPTSASKSPSPKSGGWDTHVNQGAAPASSPAGSTTSRAALAALVDRSRRPHGRHRHPHHVGVRPRGGGERQPRHRPRPRQRHVGDRRRASRAARSTAAGRVSRAEQRYDGRDLAVTTDFRDVFHQVLTRHLHATPEAAARVFTGYSPKAGLDLMREGEGGRVSGLRSHGLRFRRRFGFGRCVMDRPKTGDRRLETEYRNPLPSRAPI